MILTGTILPVPDLSSPLDYVPQPTTFQSFILKIHLIQQFKLTFSYTAWQKPKKEVA